MLARGTGDRGQGTGDRGQGTGDRGQVANDILSKELKTTTCYTHLHLPAS